MVTDPLKGFVLFENTSEIIRLSIGRGYIRISADAIRMIGDPNAINVFFDEPGKRIAVKAADSKMPNTFIMGKNTGLNKCAVLLEKILAVAEIEWHPGEVIRFNGQKCLDDYIIFDLSKSKTTKFDDHISEMNRNRKKKAAA